MIKMKYKRKIHHNNLVNYFEDPSNNQKSEQSKLNKSSYSWSPEALFEIGLQHDVKFIS